MNKKNSVSIYNLLSFLTKFVEGRISYIDNENRKDPAFMHYYNEIVRYWNRLNFILSRTTNLNNKDKKLKSDTIAKYLYIIFCYIEEKTPLDKILSEINIKNQDLRFIKKLKQFSFKRALERKPTIEKLSLIYAYPTFLIRHLESYMQKDFLKENLVQMNSYDMNTDMFSFFINNLAIKNGEELNILLRDLKDSKIEVVPDNDFSLLYYTLLKNKKKIILSHWYRTGKIIIVDKASLIVASVLAPKEGELISDSCAAPGIKTTLLAQLTNNRSKIIASDFSNKRTKEMNSLLKKLSIYSVFSLNSDSITPVIRDDIKFDSVLIDAPCTGSGALFSNPELKWRQNFNFLKQNMILQTKLLNSGINNLKPGGILVYSTCSLYAEEGELQILKFLDKLEPINLPEWVSNGYKINDQYIEGTGRLYPSIHSTKGFFISKFKKKE